MMNRRIFNMFNFSQILTSDELRKVTISLYTVLQSVVSSEKSNTGIW